MALRGSRKHVLDLISSDAAARILTGLISDVGGVVSGASRMRPASHDDAGEWDVRRFCRACVPDRVDLTPLGEWWVSEEYRGPTWDLLAECSIRGRPGFLLVEAKAHESELQQAGKDVASDASDQSRENHRRISASLERTERWFKNSVDPGCAISVASHYQLANRLSAAEALASCGVPVVLIYLGFTGDEYFGDYIKDDAHWQRVMGAYLEGVVPLAWPGTTTPHLPSGGSVTLLIRSIPADEASKRPD